MQRRWRWRRLRQRLRQQLRRRRSCKFSGQSVAETRCKKKKNNYMVCVLHVETKLKIRRSRSRCRCSRSRSRCRRQHRRLRCLKRAAAAAARWARHGGTRCRSPPASAYAYGWLLPLPYASHHPIPASCSAVLCNWESDANHYCFFFFIAIVLNFCIDFHSSSLFTVASAATAAGAARPLANKSAWHLLTDIAVYTIPISISICMCIV